VVIGGGGAADGNENTVGGNYATVGGGQQNTASDILTTIGGGFNNTASGSQATVGGGKDNTASGLNAAVPGGVQGAAESSQTFVWNDGTGYHSIPNTNDDGLSSDTAVDGEPVTGSDTFSVSASSGVRFITGGGASPTVTYIDSSGTLSLGGDIDLDGNALTDNSGPVSLGNTLDVGTNPVQSSLGNPLTLETNGGDRTLELGVPTSDGNGTTAGGNVVAGHPNNTVNNSAVGVVIGGGGANNGNENTAGANYATVGGGFENTASSNSATVGGGQQNTATDFGATVGGGDGNTASRPFATVGGGFENTASGKEATVGGGQDNTASGEHATVPGGRGNIASGKQSFAAGDWAEADADWSFVWVDGSGESDSFGGSNDRFKATTSDGSGVSGSATFNVKATSGVRFITSTDNSTVTYIPAGGTGWSNTSSRAVKTNIDPVEPREALAGVDSMEISTWEYESADEDGEGAGTTHIGPMAEDFHDAFDVGSSDEHINSINADGVALAAIQGLSAELDETRDELADARQDRAERDEHIDELETTVETQREELAEKDERVADLEAENEQLREQNAALEQRLAAVEDHLGLGGDASTVATADD